MDMDMDGMENVTMEMDNISFNCLARENLSSINITNVSHWEIVDDLQIASSVLAAFYIIFFLLAFFWNLFIVVTYLIKYKLLKHPGNLFLFNLALADLLVAVTVMMFSFVAQAAKEFVFGYTDVVRCNVCDLAGFCLMFFIFMSFHLLAALSIDRFILLAFPLRYKKIMTLGRALVIIVIIWIISLIIGVLPYIGFGQYEFNQQYGSCLPRFTGDNINSEIPNFFYVIFGVSEALIPILIIAFTNVFTYRLVSKFLRKNIQRRRTFRDPEERRANSEEEKKHKQQQKQLVRVFGALCIANCVSWTPVIGVVLAIGAAGFFLAMQIPNGVYVFGWICYLSNPVVHPIIESFFVKDLRYQVKLARTTLRRASTAIIRSTTKRFGDSDLDRANAALEAGTTPPPKRTIKFFNSKKAKEKYDPSTSHMETEEMGVDDMSSVTSTPTPEPVRREIKKIGRVGRSVTFTETASLPVSNPEGGVVLKSVLKRSSDMIEPTIIQLQSLAEVVTEADGEEESDVFGEDCVVTSEPTLSSNGVVLVQDTRLDRESSKEPVTNGSDSNGRASTLV